jgi:serine/threonine-protein kinase
MVPESYGSDHALGFLVGDVIAGKYRVEDVIGSGGMGVVVLATHVHLRERVAVKVLRADIAAEAGSVARFLREARTAMRLRSEHVVRVFDADILSQSVPYIVMEYLSGRDLARVLEEGPLKPTVAVEYLLQACEAVAEAHATGIVHRDLKPANLFLTRRPDGSPCIKLLDFGISKIDANRVPDGPESQGRVPTRSIVRLDAAATGGARTLTGATTVLGSPRYMAPEQIRSSRDVDARADVWSLGNILYECLSGTPPFHGASVPEIQDAVLRREPPPVGLLRPELPGELSAAVMRCLLKEPNERFANVAEFADAIAPFTSERAAASAARARRILQGA